MENIQHHKIEDLEFFEKQNETFEKVILKLLSTLSATNQIGRLISFVLTKIYYSKSLKLNDENIYIDLAAQLYDLLFLFSADLANKKEISFNNEKYLIERNDKFKMSYYSNYEHVIEGIYISILAKNQSSLDTLLEFPLNEIEDVSKNLDSFFLKYVHFLRAVLKKEDKAPNLLAELIKASFPDEIKSMNYSYLEANQIPSVELWTKLLSKDSDEFQKTLVESINTFKNYWSSKTKLNRGDKFMLREKPESFFSIPLSAICQVAKNNNLIFECKSDYIYQSKV